MRSDPPDTRSSSAASRRQGSREISPLLYFARSSLAAANLLLGKREQRKSKGRAGQCQGKQHEHTDHYVFLPTASITSGRITSMHITLASLLRKRVPFRVRAQASRSGARFPPHPSQCCRQGRHRRRAPAATLCVRGRVCRVRELLRAPARGTNFRLFPGALSSGAPLELLATPREIFLARH